MRIKEKRIGIDKICAILCTIMLFVTCLSGCGGQVEESAPAFCGQSEIASTSVQGGVSSGTENYNVGSGSQSIDVDALFHANSGADSTPIWAGAQYYQGEAVSLWRKRNGSEDFQKALDIYMYDSKSNGKVVVEGASGDYTGTWFMTQEGYCLTIFGNTLARIEADGTETFKVNVEGGIHDICQLEDGTVVMILKANTNSFKLAKLDTANGEYTKLNEPDLGKDNRVYIAAGENGLLLLKSNGFWNVNLQNGELTEERRMSEYDFMLPYTIKDFRLAGGGCVEFLYEGNSEIVLPKDIDKYRQVITIQTRFEDAWLQALLDDFNMTNFTYYAVMEPLVEDSTDFTGFKAALEQLSDRLANGEGPDLIELECIDSSYVENGYLENLTPYMEKTGVDSLDFFPVTFEYMKDGDSIYVANLQIQMSGMKIKDEVLGSRQIPEVETLMDALLNYPSAAILVDNWRSETVLHYLLAGSEDLWGAINWESKTCDFQTDFFAKALEVSMLFGDDGTTDLPAVAEIYNSGTLYDHINEEQLKMSNETYIGFLFDDGSHPWMLTGEALAMNSNSSNKEGAWAVIQYLLSEKAQTQEALTYENGLRLSIRICPVNVLAYEAMVLLEQEETSIFSYVHDGEEITMYKAGREEFKNMGSDEDAYRALYDLSELDADEIREMMYEARYMPEKPAEILDIIYEEAEKYFLGERSLGDTCDAIQERTQAYLDAME